MLHDELYSFICSVIAIRKRLLNEHKNHKNTMRMWKIVESLDTLLKVNRYDNNRLMAGFFYRHADEIEQILPGLGSKSSERMIQRFKELKRKAVYYYIERQPEAATA